MKPVPKYDCFCGELGLDRIPFEKRTCFSTLKLEGKTGEEPLVEGSSSSA